MKRKNRREICATAIGSDYAEMERYHPSSTRIPIYHAGDDYVVAGTEKDLQYAFEYVGAVSKKELSYPKEHLGNWNVILLEIE